MPLRGRASRLPEVLAEALEDHRRVSPPGLSAGELSAEEGAVEVKRARKAKAAPTVLDPLRDCRFCKGYGWVEDLTAPPPATRDVPGLSREVPPPRPPVRRCSCTMPERRNQVAPEPAPAGLDQARRAAGEKTEA
jgi:hypothetical protein